MKLFFDKDGRFGFEGTPQEQFELLQLMIKEQSEKDDKNALVNALLNSLMCNSEGEK